MQVRDDFALRPGTWSPLDNPTQYKTIGTYVYYGVPKVYPVAALSSNGLKWSAAVFNGEVYQVARLDALPLADSVIEMEFARYDGTNARPALLGRLIGGFDGTLVTHYTYFTIDTYSLVIRLAYETPGTGYVEASAVPVAGVFDANKVRYLRLEQTGALLTGKILDENRALMQTLSLNTGIAAWAGLPGFRFTGDTGCSVAARYFEYNDGSAVANPVGGWDTRGAKSGRISKYIRGLEDLDGRISAFGNRSGVIPTALTLDYSNSANSAWGMIV